jgi:glutamate 5-kinase
VVKKITKKIERLASTATSTDGVGGMATKIAAARDATKYGIPVIIANGCTGGILRDLFQGAATGTLFLPEKARLSSREYWIACSLNPKGNLYVDAGAREALVKKGKSLLPIGIAKVEGQFRFGDCVSIRSQRGKELGRGLTNYGSEELQKIVGFPTTAIEGILGYKHYNEVVHRDDLVIL